MKTPEIRNRITKLIEDTKLTRSSFAKAIGVRQSVIQSMYDNETAPSYKVLSAILETFSTLSAEWLMRGDGEMYRMPTMPKEEYMNNLLSLTDTISMLQETIKNQQKTIEELKSKMS